MVTIKKESKMVSSRCFQTFKEPKYPVVGKGFPLCDPDDKNDKLVLSIDHLLQYCLACAEGCQSSCLPSRLVSACSSYRLRRPRLSLLLFKQILLRGSIRRIG